MVVFPNAKINLGLRVVQKRTDGFHDIETIFYPIALYDVLEVISDVDNRATGAKDISYSGIPFPLTSDDLCLRAYNLLKKEFPKLPQVKMHLHKAVPMGAGLGGGSADASFTLKALNVLFNLALTDEQLLHYSLQLGSDCPFFIINKPAYATGRGDILEPVELDLTPYKFVVINPGIHVNTAGAFAQVVPGATTKTVKEIAGEPIETWKNMLQNDFEKFIFQTYPEIKAIKQQLYDGGAIYASMSGSGSTVYGIFEKKITVQLNMPAHYHVYELISQF